MYRSYGTYEHMVDLYSGLKSAATKLTEPTVL